MLHLGAETCENCSPWAARSQAELDMRLRNMAATTDVATHACPRCGSTAWAKTTAFIESARAESTASRMFGAIFLWLIVVPIVIALIIFGILLFATDKVHADPEIAQKCRSLVRLNEEWNGVALTAVQKVVKAQLVAWYRVNCGRRKAKWK